MNDQLPDQVNALITGYDPANPRATADGLRALWLQYEPKSMEGIKAEQRDQQETVGTPVDVLSAIGKTIGKTARKRVGDFLPLARLLWDEFGREGRVAASFLLGPMERAAPETIMPLVKDLCRTCITWEDCDQLAMRALEPVVRAEPDRWLDAVVPWLDDDNKWVRRAGITVIGRLPMKHAAYTARCLDLAGRLLTDQDTDVRRAVSFAIRVSARGEIAPVRNFLARHVPPSDPAATWVLCNVIRSMAKRLLPEFVSLLPRYEQWAAAESLSARDRRSVESAVKTLRTAAG
ncbi:MAG: DNA alkylation repair protein [Anaerolineae bacterium]|nr:DNA alkylation repair protein [Anaerolineae bacterium]